MIRRRSERVGGRLTVLMLIILMSMFIISVPLIIKSYRDYVKSSHAAIEITSLGVIADLANKISRERGPANLAMSSSPEELEKNLKGLQEYRDLVDTQLALSIDAIERGGFTDFDRQLIFELERSLANGRHLIDNYINTPFEKRTSSQLNEAIFSMFYAWDDSYKILKSMVILCESRDSSITDYYTLILVVAELRDQAGRVASDVTAHVTFNERLPSINLAESFQAQKQVINMWELVDVILPQDDKTDEFVFLYQKVKSEYIDKGIPMILKLIEESNAGVPYSLSGSQMTENIGDKFATVINLQKYLLDASIAVAKSEQHKAERDLVVNILVSAIALLTTIFTMIYAQRKVFAPLVEARDMIVDLSFTHARNSDVDETDAEDNTETGLFVAPKKVHTLYDAIQKLQEMLKQRDAFEFELKNMANTDTLTGVANRLALDEYLLLNEKISHHFDRLCLIVIDIDNFKGVNDQYGHLFGDEVIVAVANCLKKSIRSSDFIVRYGGDEFLIILEHVALNQAMRVAEQIRHAVLKMDMKVPSTDIHVDVSVSIGVAIGASTWKELLDKADKSLFQAKASGKNKVSG